MWVTKYVPLMIEGGANGAKTYYKGFLGRSTPEM